MVSFVTCTDPNAPNGLGKLLSVDGTDASCVVEYFTGPSQEPVAITVQANTLTPATPEKQTRVYVKDSLNGWHVGRVLDGNGELIEVKFPHLTDPIVWLSADRINIRWDAPIEDPAQYLACWITERPELNIWRRSFKRSLLSQRRASLGMTSILSSVIDIEAHQLKVVKTILQDPVQRYLLADEVGLGKTIEAGLVIKQYLLDHGEHAKRVVILVPTSLLVQWKSELATRFLLVDNPKIILVGMTADINYIDETLSDIGMLVVDEAHHLSVRQDLYDVIEKRTKDLNYFLLLSATPVLRNESGFLKILHLLDPNIYRLNQLPEFRERINRRQRISEISSSLIPENSLMIIELIDDLREYFLNDAILPSLIDDLDEYFLNGIPNEDDKNFVTALENVRNHLSEVYKLDRRVLRNRRTARDVQNLTQERMGVEVFYFGSAIAQQLNEELNEWTNTVVVSFLENYSKEEIEELSNKLFSLYQAVACLDQMAVDKVLKSFPEELPSLEKIKDFANEIINDYARDKKLEEIIKQNITDSNKVVVFCSSEVISTRLYNDMRDIFGDDACAKRNFNSINPTDGLTTVDNDGDAGLLKFENNNDCCILFCDHNDEEGLNLQNSSSIIIHYDILISPNRIEQRIGRLDRYGSGNAIKSFVLCSEDNKIEVAWLKFLKDGLEVFSHSIASLQYLIDEKTDHISKSILVEGVDVIDDLLSEMVGDKGETSIELKRIKQQERLDSLSDDDFDWIRDLENVDDDWRLFKENSDLWFKYGLGIQRMMVPNNVLNTQVEDARPSRYGLKKNGQKNVLVPLRQINKFLVKGIDKTVFEHQITNNNFKLFSHMYTGRRSTATSASSIQNGVRLFRLGDDFIAGVDNLTSVVDTGRTFAHWRVNDDFNSTEEFEIFLKFEFLIEADTTYAENFMNDSCGNNEFSIASIQRKIDAVFNPIFVTIWIDNGYEVVSDLALKTTLEAKFVNHSPPNRPTNEIELTYKRMLPHLQNGYLSDWSDRVEIANNRAKELVLSDVEVKNAIAEALKAAQTLDNRNLSALSIREGNNSKKHKFEKDFAAAIHTGIKKPRYKVESVGAIFLSNKKFNEVFR